jgi:hypothetical protein
VVGDGKAVRLVPDPLEEKEGHGPPGEVDRVLAARQIHTILPFSGPVQPATAAGRGKGVAFFARGGSQFINREAAL